MAAKSRYKRARVVDNDADAQLASATIGSNGDATVIGASRIDFNDNDLPIVTLARSNIFVPGVDGASDDCYIAATGGLMVDTDTNNNGISGSDAMRIRVRNDASTVDPAFRVRFDGAMVPAPLATVDQPSAVTGGMFFDTTLTEFQGYNGTSWLTMPVMETGTFTPTAEVGATTQVPTVEVGSFTRIGRLCNINIQLSFPLAGTGVFTVEGLPFTSGSGRNGLNISFLSRFFFPASGETFVARILGGTTVVSILATRAGLTSVAITHTEMTTPLEIQLNGWYEIA